MKRQVFFSFHYSNDNWRASQVRNMGRVSGESTFSDNEWEEVKLKSDAMIESWIDNQMAKRSCVVVLIGENTAGRKWINYEIKKAIELDKGIVGIYIHNLKDRFGNQNNQGRNPFDDFTISRTGRSLSSYIRCYDSPFSTSKYVYEDIQSNMEELIEYAISHRPSTW
ncbi:MULTISPECIES: TIR domain-containing protein [Streptococcus]|uniref:TIR domain-containing protein n=1 Tax=Streptococcus TaxID=1301 RepID=UPI001105B090|nr:MULTISPECIES: TIR domain-containing protein [Streptococcus]